MHAVSATDQAHALADDNKALLARFNSADVEVRAAAAGACAPWHAHPDSDELLLLLEGDYAVDTTTARHTLMPGSLLVIPAGMQHRGRSTNGARLLALLQRNSNR